MLDYIYIYIYIHDYVFVYTYIYLCMWHRGSLYKRLHFAKSSNLFTLAGHFGQCHPEQKLSLKVPRGLGLPSGRLRRDWGVGRVADRVPRSTPTAAAAGPGAVRRGSWERGRGREGYELSGDTTWEEEVGE